MIGEYRRAEWMKLERCNWFGLEVEEMDRLGFPRAHWMKIYQANIRQVPLIQWILGAILPDILKLEVRKELVSVCFK